MLRPLPCLALCLIAAAVAALSIHLTLTWWPVPRLMAALGHEVLAPWSATALALTGPGRISLDQATRHALSGRGLTRLAYLGVLGGAAYTLWKRQQTLAERAAQPTSDTQAQDA